MSNEKKPLTDEVVTYEPTGPSGNAYWILGMTSRALKRSGHADKVEEYNRRATSGDYENLLKVTGEYVVLKAV